MNSILKEKKNYLGEDKKEIWKKTYYFKDIIKTGYKLLKIIRKVKKNTNIFLDVNDLSKQSEITEDEEVKLVMEKIDIIKKYFDNKQLNISFEEKYKILEDKNNQLISDKLKSELEKNKKFLNTEYNNILEDENYKFLKDDLEKVSNSDEYEKLEKRLTQIKQSLEEKEIQKNIAKILSGEKKIEIESEILYIYSKLLAIIEDFKNINTTTVFLNRVYNFQKLIKKNQPKIDIISAYNDQIFSSCEKGSFVSQELTEIFNNMANAYLISEIVKNNLENKFDKFLQNMFKVEENIIKDIISIFDSEEYIYLPELKPKDIEY